MQKAIYYALILSIFMVVGSCMNRQFVEGRSELVRIADTTLNDSSLIEGYVQPIEEMSNYPYDATGFEIWIEVLNFKTTTDSSGYYSLKILPGTFTIKCQNKSNVWEPLIEQIKGVKIEKNKKLQIDFYLGYAIE